MTEYRYKAFISYSHSDESWARWLHRSLEWYRVPKHIVGRDTARGPIPKRLAPIFRDREELASASDLGSVLENALASSQALIVICSPASARSRWVNEEIRFFKNLGRADEVYCLIVDGEPNADAGKGVECFPPALLEVSESDGASATVEPIAADVRPGGDGKQAAKLKLIAGLLGVGLDEIRQRENQRRQRRLIQIASGAVVGMLIATALATAAFMARAEAERQRVRAEQEAETASQTSEFLVSLFNVVDPSEARGNTVTAREILDRGAERIDRELVGQPAVRSNLLRTMGRVYSGLGLYAKSTELLESAVQSGRLADDSMGANDSKNLTALARALYLKGEYEAAEARAAEAARLASEQETPNEQLRDALIVQADLALQSEADARAEALFRQALVMDQALSPEPGTPRATILHGLGVSRFYQGDAAQATEQVAQALALREALLGEDHPETFEALNTLSFFAFAQSDLQESERLLRIALPRAQRVFGEVHPETSTYMNNLARVQLEQGAIEQAEQTLVAAVALDREFKDPMHDDFAFSLNNLALVRAIQARFDEAGALYTEALAVARKHQHDMEGSILANLADLQCQRGQAQEGAETARAARAALARVRAPDDWRFAHLASIEGACLQALAGNTESNEQLAAAYAQLADLRGPDWLFARLAQKRLEGTRGAP